MVSDARFGTICTTTKDSNTAVAHDDGDSTSQAQRDVERGGDASESERRPCCCSCPHGKGPLTRAIIATLVALSLADAATDVCAFLNATTRFGDSTATKNREIGINTYRDDAQGCVPWRQGDDRFVVYDSVWKAVRWMVGVASVVAFVAWVFLLTASCVHYQCPRLFEGLGYGFLFIALLYELSFLVFASDICREHGCTIDNGGIIMIVACLAWLVASWTVFEIPAQRQHETGQQSRPPAWRFVTMASLMMILGAVINGIVIGVRNT